MGIGLRYFLFEEDGALRHVPQRVVEGLALGTARLPQYAGQSLRAFDVLLETENGKPVEIIKLTGDIWHFDEKGRTRQDWIGSAVAALSTDRAVRQAPTDGPVVDITARIARRRWEEHNRWEPSPADINRIIHIIWPETAGRPVKRPKTITGVRKRRPPMTLEAKQTISKCREAVWSIVSRLDDLSEPSLKAVIGKIEGLAEKMMI